MFWNPKMLHLGGALLVLSTTCCAMRPDKGAELRLGRTISETIVLESADYEQPTFYNGPSETIPLPPATWSCSRSSPRNEPARVLGEQKKESSSDDEEEDATILGVESASAEEAPEDKPSDENASKGPPKYFLPLLGVLLVANWLAPAWKMATNVENGGVPEGNTNASRGDGYFNSFEKVGHTFQGLLAVLLLPEWSWSMVTCKWCGVDWRRKLQWLQPLVMVGAHLFYNSYNILKRNKHLGTPYYCAKGCVCDDIEDDVLKAQCEALETKDACEGSEGKWTGVPNPDDEACHKVFYNSSYYVNLVDFDIGYTVGAVILIILSLLALCVPSVNKFFSKKDANSGTNYKRIFHYGLVFLAAVVLFAVAGTAIQLGTDTRYNLSTNLSAGRL